MTALRMMLCGEIQKSVEHREKEFKTYDELRAVVTKWAVNRKIENERANHDPMDCNPVQDNQWPDSTWEDWQGYTQSTPTEQSPQDVDYMNANSKGKGKGDSKGGKGPSNQNPAQYYFHMMMKAMKGGGKGYSGGPHTGT